MKFYSSIYPFFICHVSSNLRIRPARLLLRKAVDRAEAEDEVDGVDADDPAVGEERGQGVERLAVGRVIEGRDEHQAVGDVEVGIAGWEPLPPEDDRLGHRQVDDAERLAVLVARRPEPPPVLLERLVV